jgi:hypothetical protein
VEPLSFRAFVVTEASSVFDFRVKCVASAGAPATNGEIAWEEVSHCDIIVAGITRHPDREWMEQIGHSATQVTWGYLHPCRYVLHDRDTKFCGSFRSALACGGVKTIPLHFQKIDLHGLLSDLAFQLGHFGILPTPPS